MDPTLGDNGALCLTVLQSAFTAALLLLMLRYHHLHHKIARLRKCLLAAAAARAVVAEERWWQRHVHRLYVVAEALVLLIHPMPGDVLPVQLEIFMWLRLYLILRVARDFSTVYVSEYDAPFSWALAINSWLYARPATTVTSSLLLIMGFAAYGTLISERTHVHALRAVGGAEAAAEIDVSISGERGLDVSPQTWSESLWLVAIVMTTVGFGDFAPVSFVGRLLTLAAALVGILLSALMISIVQNQLTLSFQQGYAVKCLIRDRLQEKLEHCAALLIKNQWQIHLRGGHLKDEDATSSSRLSRKASRAFGDTKSVIKRKLSRAGSALSNQEARLSQEGRLPQEGELRSSCGRAAAEAAEAPEEEEGDSDLSDNSASDCGEPATEAVAATKCPLQPCGRGKLAAPSDYWSAPSRITGLEATVSEALVEAAEAAEALGCLESAPTVQRKSTSRSSPAPAPSAPPSPPSPLSLPSPASVAWEIDDPDATNATASVAAAAATAAAATSVEADASALSSASGIVSNNSSIATLASVGGAEGRGQRATEALLGGGQRHSRVEIDPSQNTVHAVRAPKHPPVAPYSQPSVLASWRRAARGALESNRTGDARGSPCGRCSRPADARRPSRSRRGDLNQVSPAPPLTTVSVPPQSSYRPCPLSAPISLHISLSRSRSRRSA